MVLALLDPARPGQLLLGLAVVAAMLLVAVAAGLRVRVPAVVPAAVRAAACRGRAVPRPRLADPGAAGRPRPRAPSRRPAVA